MSLVDFFFNSNYREKCLDKGSKPIKDSRTEEQKIRDKNKFWRDYHLNKCQEHIDRLNDNITYNFLDLKLVTKEVFNNYLKYYNSENWTIPVLWNRFKLKHDIHE